MQKLFLELSLSKHFLGFSLLFCRKVFRVIEIAFYSESESSVSRVLIIIIYFLSNYLDLKVNLNKDQKTFTLNKENFVWSKIENFLISFFFLQKIDLYIVRVVYHIPVYFPKLSILERTPHITWDLRSQLMKVIRRSSYYIISFL